MLQKAKKPWWKFWKKDKEKSNDTQEEGIKEDTKKPWWKFWKKSNKSEDKPNDKEDTDSE